MNSSGSATKSKLKGRKRKSDEGTMRAANMRHLKSIAKVELDKKIKARRGVNNQAMNRKRRELSKKQKTGNNNNDSNNADFSDDDDDCAASICLRPSGKSNS